MKRNNKLTPGVYKEIMRMAEGLPVMYRTDSKGKVLLPIQTTVVKGSEIKGQLPDGSTPIGYKLYVKKEHKPLTMNHAVEMLDLFKRKGMAAVESYAAEVTRIAKQAEENKKRNKELKEKSI